MKRRDFVQKSGCGLFGLMMAYFGLTSCKKQKAPAEEPVKDAMSQKDIIKNLLMEKKSLTAEYVHLL